MYKVELLAGERNEPSDQTMAEAYVRTALELREMAEPAFFANVADEGLRLCAGYPSLSSDDVGRLMLDLHQRQGHDVWRVLNNAIGAHSRALIARNLPATSILMMTVAPGLTPSLGSDGRREDVIRDQFEAAGEALRTTDPASQSFGLDERPARKNAPTVVSGPKRGRPPLKFDAVKRAMKDDLESGRLTSENLQALHEKQLSNDYLNVSRDTARKARNAVLSEFVEKSKGDK
jgi:hypothetical protein